MASVGSAIRAACLAVREEVAKGRNDRPIEATATSQRDPQAAERFSMHSFGAVFVEIAVDPDVGTIRARRAVGAWASAASSIRGLPQPMHRRHGRRHRHGADGAHCTRCSDGRPVNAHMADYLMPVNLDIPRLEAHFVDETDPHVNALGVKGLGEIALVGIAPAIANAVFHATGKRVRTLPIRIEDVLTA
ncbi:hypothetical protein ACFIOY_05580 [Bradyrhizobium sp. TZ2]